MSSNVHFKIRLQQFIYQRTLEKKKTKEYNSIDRQQQLFNILPFFLTTTHLIVMMRWLTGENKGRRLIVVSVTYSLLLSRVKKILREEEKK
jgi:hypothetical protein